MEAKRYIGIDLHRNCFTACLRLENGREYLKEWKLEEMGKFAEKRRPSDQVAVEVTGNTRLFHDAVAPHVARVVAVNPSQFQVITHSVKKTDPNDARNLALYLAKDLLPEVRMKDKTQAQIASLTQTRDSMVKLRTALKNKVNNLCSAQGVNLNKESLSSQKGLKAVLEMHFDLLVNLELKIIVDQIRSLNKSIAELEETIGKQGQQLEGHRNLTSIKGIGGLGGSILLSIIGDIGDFADEGKLAAYFGIVPRVSNSNETEHSGRITKRGTKLGRTTLIQCALIAQRYSPYLKTYYEKMKRRRARARRSSPWRANSWESSIERSRISGCSKTSSTLYWRRKRRREHHRLPLRSARLRSRPGGPSGRWNCGKPNRGSEPSE
jgi:transposase